MSDVPQSSQVIRMTCYHTCKKRGDRESLLGLVPFHSNNNKAQWLGAGYYLWTDSDHFAHKWGKDSYSDNYVITRFELSVSKDDFLDLVGSVEDQLDFNQHLKDYRDTICRAISQGRLANQVLDDVTVLDCINHLKRQGLFGYLAVKAADIPPRGLERTKYSKNKPEVLLTPTRQQIVVYPPEDVAKQILGQPCWHFSTDERK